VTFVVVQKRHHTRLFANDHRDRNSVDKSGNILPGLCLRLLYWEWEYIDNIFMKSPDFLLELQELLLIPRFAILLNLTSICVAMLASRSFFYS